MKGKIARGSRVEGRGDILKLAGALFSLLSQFCEVSCDDVMMLCRFLQEYCAKDGPSHLIAHFWFSFPKI
jgi:hypothetical protein